MACGSRIIGKAALALTLVTAVSVALAAGTDGQSTDKGHPALSPTPGNADQDKSKTKEKKPSTPSNTGNAPAPAATKPGAAPSPKTAPSTLSADDAAGVLGFTMKRIDGKPESLETYKGRVVLIVNVASECGLTPQYAGIEKLYREKKDAGLVVLGFPANNFGGQEPGTNGEIEKFCTTKHGVTFPMFEKISVLGDDQHPLFRKLSEATKDSGGAPNWNFTKYLVDRSGRVVARFDPRVKPEDPQLVAKIDELLAAKH